MDRMFSLKEYSEIIDLYSGRIKSFNEAKNASDFVILRHDVEFSVTRALKMARFEEIKGVRSTFFFQVMSNAYNPFSKTNYDAIHMIINMGHSVGLHAYVSHLNEPSSAILNKELKKQKTIFEKGLGIECLSFSFHRPPKWALEVRADKICNMLNAYGPSFFELSSQPKHIKYVADSRHTWSYGHPSDQSDRKKIQILTHPDEWTEDGDNNLVEFFKELQNEHNRLFINTLHNETKHYGETFQVSK